MNTKHTPGPWTHKDSHEETSAIFAGEDRDLIADARTVADARLIAAAPELLAALREAEAALTVLHPHNRYMDGTVKPGPSTLLISIRAAIAKAEGKSWASE